jgi:DNA mismatch endonuclease, patch repair protein
MDSLAKEARSALMAKVRSRGNRSTEVQLRLALVRAEVAGWKLHPKSVFGQPDFWFPRNRVALFVDGCFWHGCKRCLRLPKSNRRYWKDKIGGNINRAKLINRELRSIGITVLRFWEHDVNDYRTLKRLVTTLRRRVG